ncbi:GATA zinc finger domain-containing protein 15-like [Calliphora vicina]|uniref:GATA zinc finger domain-containing protein 15-like n=1 Tax=Calliphora vicina TaxID=7373 RepID=UPI00325BC947
MAIDRRADWRCHTCKTRKASTNSNNAYHVIIDDTHQPTQTANQQKQQRDEYDDDVYENDGTKRFKDSLSLSDVNNSVYHVKTNVSTLKSDVSTMKSDITEIKTTIQQLAISVNQNNQINTNIQTALNTITSTLSTLTSQKLRKAAYSLYHLSNCSTYDVLQQAYFSLAETYIRHGITAWGNSTYCRSLQQSQNQILKILMKNKLHNQQQLQMSLIYENNFNMYTNTNNTPTNPNNNINLFNTTNINNNTNTNINTTNNTNDANISNT